MSIPVSFRIISSNGRLSFVAEVSNRINNRMVFRFLARISISQKTVMSNFDKSFGQAMKQQVSNKLHGTDGDWFCAVFLSVFGGKSYHAVFELL